MVYFHRTLVFRDNDRMTTLILNLHQGFYIRVMILILISNRNYTSNWVFIETIIRFFYLFPPTSFYANRLFRLQLLFCGIDAVVNQEEHQSDDAVKDNVQWN